MKASLPTTILGIVWAWFIFSALYTVLTGDVLWSNVHYQTGGRIVAGASVVIVLGLAISMFRVERRWKRERRKFRSSIPHRCPARDGEAQCIEAEGHEGPHDYRFDYD